ncbi:winged helix-turn-helix domain-containing protein [Rheinheimera sp. MMS21-TC3]|uniref:winged helix-turn-helix domain-containing protein n=1 Tax=Rheinheimera sp. MMS21-TC3 TaxID=3072790 RepID=UPI0028C3C35C|nr:winged helix-turn-helix domain-containing protein [Rheinheimera sp. MMS21-TC3]WNO59621.1 winged helix-turn-helix domain-containing protein [Rheinheimera sp. MMS21-TC3]
MNKSAPFDPAVQWQLGEIIFDSRTRQLSYGNKQLYLEPRQHQLLLCLLSNPELPTSRSQLIQTVWQGRIVSDGAINRAVSMLRKAFTVLDPNVDYITTIPKLGYQLVAHVQTITVNNSDQAVCNLIPSSPRSGYRRLVLPITLLILLSCFLLWYKTQSLFIPLSTGNAIPHTSFNGYESQLSSNIQGLTLLYQRQAANGNNQIWLNSLTDNHHYALTPDNENSQSAALSPDGSQFAYVRYKGADCEIILQALDEAASNRVLHQCLPDNKPLISWHKDSNFLYFRQRQDKTHPYHLYQLSIASGALHQLTLLATDYTGQGDIALAASPFQQLIAAVRYQSEEASEVLLLDSNNQTIHSEIIPIRAKTLAWYNQTTLLLSAGQTLYQYHLDTSQLKPLYHAANPINSFVVINNTLYFASTELSANVWQKNDANPAAVRIDSSRLDTMPRLSNDAKQLAFLSDRQGHRQIWLQDAKGNEQLLSELPGQPAFVRLEWSQNDQQLLFSKDGAIYSVQIASGRLTTLLTADKQATVANFGSDENSIIYSSQRSGDWQLWLYDLRNKTEQQLTEQGGYSGRIWQNRLYFTKYHQDGIWFKELGSGEEQILLASIDKINWLNWDIDQDQLYYYVPQQGIYGLDLASSKVTLLLAEPSRFVRHFSVRQGKIVYIRHSELQGDIYRLPLKVTE